jgi:hypothetical protein
MGDSFVVAGLRRKRAQIAGYIAEHERKAVEWRQALAKLDATLKLFDPDIDPTAIPAIHTPRRTPYYDGYQLTRIIWDTLRKAEGEPVSTDYIFAAAVVGGALPDQPHVRVAVRHRIINTLNQRDKRGEIIRLGMGRSARWKLPQEQLPDVDDTASDYHSSTDPKR